MRGQGTNRVLDRVITGRLPRRGQRPATDQRNRSKPGRHDHPPAHAAKSAADSERALAGWTAARRHERRRAHRAAYPCGDPRRRALVPAGRSTTSNGTNSNYCEPSSASTRHRPPAAAAAAAATNSARTSPQDQAGHLLTGRSGLDLRRLQSATEMRPVSVRTRAQPDTDNTSSA
jgi:hypothetical protein